MKLYPYIFIFLILTINSCSNKTFKCNCDTSLVSKNDSILKSPEVKKGLSNIRARYMQEALTNLNNESYRLSTKRAFNKYYQVYTLSKLNEGGNLLIQEFLCDKPFDIECKLDSEYNLKITEYQWNFFKKIIDKNCFWTFSIDDPDRGEYLDGSEWYLEGYQPDKRNCSKFEYLITYRKIPQKDKHFYNIVQSILNLVNPSKVHL